MAEWKVNDVIAADLNIENISITLNNMTPDVCRITLAELYDASILAAFEFGQIVAIKLDGVQVFWGTSQGPTRGAPPEGISIEVLGGWYELESCPYIGSVSDLVSGGSFSSGSCKIASGTVTASATAIVNYAITTAVGAKLKKGTIDLPAATLPEISLSSASCASALKTVLQLVPGVQVVFDYSAASAVAPIVYPTIHVLKLTSTSLSAFSVPETAETAFAYKKKLDLVPAGVKIIYQRPASQTIEYSGNDTSRYNSSGMTYVSTDSAGTVSPSRRVVIATLDLNGTKSLLSRRFQIGCFAYHNLTWLGQHSVNGFTNLGKTIEQMGHGVSETIYNSAPYYSPNSSYPFCTEYSITGWGWFPSNPGTNANYHWIIPKAMEVPTEFKLASGLQYITATVRTGWCDAAHKGADGYGAAQYVFTFTMFTVYKSPSCPHGTNIIINSDTTADALEAAPAGLASIILSQLSAVFMEGSHAAEFSAISPLKRLALIGAISSPIQGITFDSRTMLLSATFGPPDQLAPQDILALVRAVTGLKSK